MHKIIHFLFTGFFLLTALTGSATVRLPALFSDNMVLQVALASRATPETPWHVHWQGQVSSVAGGNSPEQKIRFAPTVDREWRLVVLRGAETLGTTRPALELAYHPARLRFLAQGTAPYRLAFGSARVSPAEVAGCDSLLSASSGQGAHLMGQAVASPGSAARFGGSEALTPPREPTPVRLMVLWGVLIAGVAVLIGLAISLMRRLQNPAVRS